MWLARNTVDWSPHTFVDAIAPQKTEADSAANPGNLTSMSLFHHENLFVSRTPSTAYNDQLPVTPGDEKFLNLESGHPFSKHAMDPGHIHHSLSSIFHPTPSVLATPTAASSLSSDELVPSLSASRVSDYGLTSQTSSLHSDISETLQSLSITAKNIETKPRSYVTISIFQLTENL